MRLALAVVAALFVTSTARAEPTRHDTATVDFLGLRSDHGGRGSSLGLGYVRAHEEWSGRGGIGPGMWFGYGADLRVLTRRFDAVDGALGFAVGRVSMMGCAGGFGLEIGVGGGDAGRGAQIVMQPGVYWGAYFVELGYSYAAPLAPMVRPDALSSHQFSVRVHIPLNRSNQRTWFESTASP